MAVSCRQPHQELSPWEVALRACRSFLPLSGSHETCLSPLPDPAVSPPETRYLTSLQFSCKAYLWRDVGVKLQKDLVCTTGSWAIMSQGILFQAKTSPLTKWRLEVKGKASARHPWHLANVNWKGHSKSRIWKHPKYILSCVASTLGYWQICQFNSSIQPFFVWREKRLLPGAQRWCSSAPGNPALLYSNSTVTYAGFRRLNSVILANSKFSI